MRQSLITFVVAATALLSSTPALAAVPLWQFDRQHHQLDLQLDQPTQLQARLVSNPSRLVIDLPGIHLGQKSFTTPLPDEMVRSIRFGQFETNMARVVLELAPGYTIDPAGVKFKPLSGRHWTIELPTPIAVAPETTIAANDIEIAVPTLPANELPPTKQAGKLLVVIDPGHGGPDVGAVGIGGIQEKDIVWDISQQLADRLRQRGIEVVLTRDGDIDLDLEPRVALAERLQADLFVSVHANSINMQHPEVNGLQTYYFHDNSLNLASSIHQSVLQELPINDRGVRTARFYVIRNTSMPAVLVEVGFVTGSDDSAHLADPNYRAKTATAIADGIVQSRQAYNNSAIQSPPR